MRGRDIVTPAAPAVESLLAPGLEPVPPAALATEAGVSSAAGLISALLLPGSTVDFPQITEVCERLEVEPREIPEAVRVLGAALRGDDLARREADRAVASRMALKSLTIANEMMYNARVVDAFQAEAGVRNALETLRCDRSVVLGEAADGNIRMLATEVLRKCFADGVTTVEGPSDSGPSSNSNWSYFAAMDATRTKQDARSLFDSARRRSYKSLTKAAVNASSLAQKAERAIEQTMQDVESMVGSFGITEVGGGENDVYLKELQQSSVERRQMQWALNESLGVSALAKAKDTALALQYALDPESAPRFFEGGRCQVSSGRATMRAGEAMDSRIVGELEIGTVVRILSFGTESRRRAHVRIELEVAGTASADALAANAASASSSFAGKDDLPAKVIPTKFACPLGWISLWTARGEYLFRDIGDDSSERCATGDAAESGVTEDGVALAKRLGDCRAMMLELTRMAATAESQLALASKSVREKEGQLEARIGQRAARNCSRKALNGACCGVSAARATVETAAVDSATVGSSSGGAGDAGGTACAANDGLAQVEFLRVRVATLEANVEALRVPTALSPAVTA